MSDWQWDYLTDAEHVVGGLPTEQVQQIEGLARRLADAVGVKHLGEPAAEESGVSDVLSLAEGPLMVWYQEHWRHRTVYILRVQHLGD